ncbi:hypothetical protein NQ314_013557 [Rhamnusium bicolor]|uniref:UmuC domain-containing protein n=1 Tax=Rhamnusium bicolor TaxID=1586634 RepID=A0AAV8X6T5_9CUCU|nr:hypothetical protein NQ314_013557 [Rhamnusium bicolor]
MEAESTLDDHSRTIIHIDLDCFYAQVEMVKNPELRTLPLGIQQKNIVVTSNYIARQYGIKKCMLITEAKKMCPNLVLVKGEDLHDYRQTSYKVTTLLQKYSNLVERLGLDENFIDVTSIVNEKIEDSTRIDIVGNVFGDISDLCDCGCSDRLKIGTNIAQEIRDQIKSELNLTTCAGVGHNKLLAKIAGSKHKPNEQTVIFPNSAVELMLSLNLVSYIPGIGTTLTEQLGSINIKTVQDLHNMDFVKLKNLLGSEKAKTVHDLSFGLDRTPVKSTGKPQSIGIEDSCKSISIEKEVREKLRQLLSRLLVLVGEDGRVPKTIKLTIRKFDRKSKVSNRETRQCNINTTLFNPKDISKLTETNENKILTAIMRLFNKLVNTNKPYHITLLGLSFTKFVERPSAKSTLTKFLIKDIEVQSITNIENVQETKTTPDDSPSTSYVENSETEPEPTPKKCKFSDFIAKKRFLRDSDDCASPSKLRVAELRLNSTEKSMDTNQNISCPPDASEEVFRELPRDVQQELWEEYKQTRDRDKVCSNQLKKPNQIV